MAGRRPSNSFVTLLSISPMPKQGICTNILLICFTLIPRLKKALRNLKAQQLEDAAKMVLTLQKNLQILKYTVN